MRLLTVPQVAERLQISQRQAWRLVLRGDIPSLKLSNNRRVPADALDAYLAEQLRGEAEAVPS